MKPTRLAPLVAAIALLAPPVLAQTPPPTTQPPGNEPTPPPGDAPPMPTTTSPQPSSGEEPERKLKMTEDDTEEKESEEEVFYGVGARTRFITTPKWLIELFVEHATSMVSFSVAGEFVRRKGNFDLVVSVEWSKVAPEDGLYEEKGESPNQVDMYPDFYDFDSNFSFLSADVSFIWHFPLTDFMAFRIGPGVGLGIPIGSWQNTDTVCDSTTTIDDLDDPNACAPVPGTTEQGDPPPVVPVVNLLMGFRFKIVDQLSVNIEGGWRLPAFFIGGGIGYFF
jgi:hypothetical protein